jgi:hypothetical protein
MSSRRLLVVATLLLAVTVAANASGVASFEGDRSLVVDVTDDERGYVGFDQTTTNPSDGQTDLVVTVTNQFPTGTTLATVAVSVNGTTVVRPTTGTLAPGESVEASFASVPCGAAIAVEVGGTDVNAEFTRVVACA